MASKEEKLKLFRKMRQYQKDLPGLDKSPAEKTLLKSKLADIERAVGKEARAPFHKEKQMTKKMGNVTNKIDTKGITKLSNAEDVVKRGMGITRKGQKEALKSAAKKAALSALKTGGKKAAMMGTLGLLGKTLLGPGVALAGEALDSPAAGVPVERGIAEGIKKGKLPGKLRDATIGALEDIKALKKKKKKNLVEE